MVLVTVLYPKHETSHFDHEYYLQQHIPMVQSVWGGHGLEKTELMRGTATLDGNPPAFELIGHLSFTSLEHMEAALAAAGHQVIADIPNFTNVQPVIQIDQPITL